MLKPKIKLELPPITTKEDFVAIDLEIFQMNSDRLHRPTSGKFASLQICIDGEEVFVITDEKQVSEAMKRIKTSTHVFHNSMFDVVQLRRWCKYPNRKNLVDTLIRDRILHSGYFDSFSLKDLARRYLGIKLDKDVRDDFITQSEMNPDLIHYAAMDALITKRCFDEQQKLVEPWAEYIYRTVDLPAQWAIMDFKGFRIDEELWMNNVKRLEKEVARLIKQFEFNPNSPPQSLKYLRESGVKVSATNAKVLKKYADNPVVAQLMEYREANKALRTYGEEFLRKHSEDGYIYSDYNVNVAKTGRTSSSTPNMQNIPSAKNYRNCFIPSEGNVLIIIDYQSQEPRITAYETQDAYLLDIIISGKSSHVEVGKKIFNDPKLTKKSPKYKIGKSLNLGITYGLTASGLVRDVNNSAECEEEKITYDQAKEFVTSYFTHFPSVYRYIEDQRKFALMNGYVETKLGRRCRVNTFDYQWKNIAINAAIQGGAGDVTKRALAAIHKDKSLGYYVVGEVHDEIVADVPIEIATDYADLMERCMIDEAQNIYEGIPFGVDRIDNAKDWSEKP